MPPECRGWGHVWFGWTGDLSRLRRLSLLLGYRSMAAVLLLSSVAPCLALKERPLTGREGDDACRCSSAGGRGCAGLAGHGAGPVGGFASVCLSLYFDGWLWLSLSLDVAVPFLLLALSAPCDAGAVSLGSGRAPMALWRRWAVFCLAGSSPSACNGRVSGDRMPWAGRLFARASNCPRALPISFSPSGFRLVGSFGVPCCLPTRRNSRVAMLVPPCALRGCGEDIRRAPWSRHVTPFALGCRGPRGRRPFSRMRNVMLGRGPPQVRIILSYHETNDCRARLRTFRPPGRMGSCGRRRRRGMLPG